MKLNGGASEPQEGSQPKGREACHTVLVYSFAGTRLPLARGLDAKSVNKKKAKSNQ